MARVFTRARPRWLLVILGFAFIGLQLTNPAHTNPPIDEARTIQRHVALPPEVSAVFTRSCNDCHSNETNWPWYTYIAPVSWLTVSYVEQGRAQLNFSEWGSYGEHMKGSRLRAIRAQCESGKMPLPSYARMHRGVALTRDEVQTISAWTLEEGKRLTETRPSVLGASVRYEASSRGSSVSVMEPPADR